MKPQEKNDTDERIIRRHTALPYALGGNCAKYQGFDNTYNYLQREHAGIWNTTSDEIVRKIIIDEINNWKHL
jgi:hypothetical protein